MLHVPKYAAKFGHFFRLKCMKHHKLQCPLESVSYNRHTHRLHLLILRRVNSKLPNSCTKMWMGKVDI